MGEVAKHTRLVILYTYIFATLCAYVLIQATGLMHPGVREDSRIIGKSLFPLCTSAFCSKLCFLCSCHRAQIPNPPPFSRLLWDRLGAEVRSRLAGNVGHLGNELRGCRHLRRAKTQSTHTHKQDLYRTYSQETHLIHLLPIHIHQHINK